MTLWKVAAKPSRRLTRIFLADDQSSGPVNAWYAPYQNDSPRRDPVLFCEYFHGDDGSGVGASHQTGSAAPPEEQEILAEVSA